MIKALLKKQFLETASFFFFSSKDNKKRSPLAIFGFCALMVYAVGASAVIFYQLAKSLCAPLVAGGLAWVYFAFSGLTAFGIGAIGSVFFVKAKLFEAKDNDLLLSMPIPAWAVIFTRMLSLYAFAFAFTALAWFPAVVEYSIVAGVQPLALVFSLVVALVLPLGELAVCCLLGWLIALVTAKARAKNILTLAFFAVFMVAYFIIVGKINEYLTFIITNGEAVGNTLKKIYPFYLLGKSATGEGIATLIFSLIFTALFALVYLLLSKTFLTVAIFKSGERGAKGEIKSVKGRTPFTALFIRECKRLFSNPMIYLNCALGSVFLLVLPVLALFNLDFLDTLTGFVGGDLSLLLCVIVCGVSAMNCITASSVSLEGESLWIVRSMPVCASTVLTAKLALHFLVTAIPAVLCASVLGIVLSVNIGWIVLEIVSALIFTALCAELGLVFNLKLPNLHWTSEISAVKQGMSPLLSMLANIGVTAFSVILYIALGKYMPPIAYLLCVLGVFSVACAGLGIWLKKRGTLVFESL